MVLVGRSEGRRLLGRPTCRWEDKIKMDLQGLSWRHRLDRSGSRQGEVAGSCECSNEPLGSIKCEEFFGQLRNQQHHRKPSASQSQSVSYNDSVHVNLSDKNLKSFVSSPCLQLSTSEPYFVQLVYVCSGTITVIVFTCLVLVVHYLFAIIPKTTEQSSMAAMLFFYILHKILCQVPLHYILKIHSSRAPLR